MQATAIAQPNIALIKYWGKRDVARNLPAVGSISITLSDLFTRMRVKFDPQLANDELTVNEAPDTRMLPRLSACLDEVAGEDVVDAKGKVTDRRAGRIPDSENRRLLEKIRKAGELVLATFAEVEAMLRPGLVTEEINTVVHAFTVRHGATPAPLNYRGFPKSVCVSINDVICHGIPGPRVLEDGDIVNVDITSILDGYYADANKTFFVGTPGEDARKIVRVSKESLKQGLQMVRPGATLGDISWAIHQYADGQGCSVVREFVGHGVGFDFHEPPQVPHYGRKGSGLALIPGMVFTIEPGIYLPGKYGVRWENIVIVD